MGGLIIYIFYFCCDTMGIFFPVAYGGCHKILQEVVTQDKKNHGVFNLSMVVKSQ